MVMEAENAVRLAPNSVMDMVRGMRAMRLQVFAASNTNLEEAVRRGEFREDIHSRIHVIVIHLPPLRERKEDFEKNHLLQLIETAKGNMNRAADISGK